MHQTPFWTALEPMAHLLVRDAALLGAFTLPSERLAARTVPMVPTLVLDSGQMP